MKQAVKSPAADQTILVVEDDVALREMLAEMLKSLNCTIFQAGSLAGAIMTLLILAGISREEGQAPYDRLKTGKLHAPSEDFDGKFVLKRKTGI